MYIARDLTKVYQSAIEQFPAVLITGPRQSGKSTFLKHVSKDAPYITFDDPLNREFVLKDPNGFLDQFDGNRVILDEIQYVPEILQYIKIRIDNDRRPGVWILTGSQQFPLMKGISETLAGRIAILELMPFSIREIKASKETLETTLWAGLYPEPACYPEKRELWLNSYIQTYIERDVRRLADINDFRGFEMFINLCSTYHSREFHPASLARDCGVSQPTIKSWGKILERSYILIMLPPFFRNYGKRLIKTPKLYFMDPSIVCFLTRQPSGESAFRGSMGGPLFEGLVISDVWKTFLNCGKEPSAFFWRAQGGLEVDLIIQAGGKFWPIEIKLTSTPTINHLNAVNRFRELAGDEAGDRGILVCNVDKKMNLPGNNIAIPWFRFSEWLRELIGLS
jgi:predicted AAA+ superfamily ATPase